MPKLLTLRARDLVECASLWSGCRPDWLSGGWLPASWSTGDRQEPPPLKTGNKEYCPAACPVLLCSEALYCRLRAAERRHEAGLLASTYLVDVRQLAGLNARPMLSSTRVFVVRRALDLRLLRNLPQRVDWLAPKMRGRSRTKPCQEEPPPSPGDEDAPARNLRSAIPLHNRSTRGRKPGGGRVKRGTGRHFVAAVHKKERNVKGSLVRLRGPGRPPKRFTLAKEAEAAAPDWDRGAELVNNVVKRARSELTEPLNDEMTGRTSLLKTTVEGDNGNVEDKAKEAVVRKSNRLRRATRRLGEDIPLMCVTKRRCPNSKTNSVKVNAKRMKSAPDRQEATGLINLLNSLHTSLTKSDCKIDKKTEEDKPKDECPDDVMGVTPCLSNSSTSSMSNDCTKSPPIGTATNTVPLSSPSLSSSPNSSCTPLNNSVSERILLRVKRTSGNQNGVGKWAVQRQTAEAAAVAAAARDVSTTASLPNSWFMGSVSQAVSLPLIAPRPVTVRPTLSVIRPAISNSTASLPNMSQFSPMKLHYIEPSSLLGSVQPMRQSFASTPTVAASAMQPIAPRLSTSALQPLAPLATSLSTAVLQPLAPSLSTASMQSFVPSSTSAAAQTFVPPLLAGSRQMLVPSLTAGARPRQSLRSAQTFIHLGGCKPVSLRFTKGPKHEGGTGDRYRCRQEGEQQCRQLSSSDLGSLSQQDETCADPGRKGRNLGSTEVACAAIAETTTGNALSAAKSQPTGGSKEQRQHHHDPKHRK